MFVFYHKDETRDALITNLDETVSLHWSFCTSTDDLQLNFLTKTARWDAKVEKAFYHNSEVMHLYLGSGALA